MKRVLLALGCMLLVSPALADTGWSQYGGDQGGQRGTYGGGQYGGGYDQGGYDQSGYDDQRGGYTEQPSRRGPVQPSHPGQRRSSDWDG